MGAYELLFKNNGEKITSTTLKKTHTDFGRHTKTFADKSRHKMLLNRLKLIVWVVDFSFSSIMIN
ncbi:MAG: hypothetical protein C0490_23995 [Marivirga sp.]|nr:hypothetical protein [Marivirga sp.]